MALTNPWNIQNPPCIPDTISIPSHKFTVSTTVQFNAGTAGVGFIVIQGMGMLASDGGTTSIFPPPAESPAGAAIPPFQMNPIMSTTTAYAGTAQGSFNVINPATATLVAGVVGNWAPGSPYSGATFNGGKPLARLVGMGLSIAPTGQLSTRAGTISLIRFDPNYYPGNDTTFGYIQSRQDTFTTAINAGPYMVTYLPKHPDDIDYKNVKSLSVATTEGNNAQYTVLEANIGAYIFGATPGEPYHARIVAHFETVGNALSVTPSHTDSVAMGHVVAAAASLEKGPDGAINPNVAIKETVKEMAKAAGRAMGSAVYMGTGRLARAYLAHRDFQNNGRNRLN